MNHFSVYIDETGDPDFNDKASTTFLMGAVIINNNEIEHCHQIYTKILHTYGFSELKSASKISLTNRLTILSEILNVNVKIASIMVDKRKLKGDWFKYRGNFYKFIQSKLNGTVLRLFENIDVKIDQFGSIKFQKSLLKYLKEKAQGELFEPNLQITSAKNEPFIQIADFIFGSIRRAYETNYYFSEKIINYFGDHWYKRILIPDSGKYLDIAMLAQPVAEFDFCIKEVKRYLEANEGKVSNAKILSLEYLYYSMLEDSDRYIYTEELLKWLKNFNIVYNSDEQFRNEVLASLRDDGIIITGTRKGLKIPSKLLDIKEYIEFNTNLTLPILRRLNSAINFFRARFNNDDILDNLNPEMRNILKQVNS